MILGFEPSATTDDRLAKQQSLWTDWVAGLAGLPINLPGFSKTCLQACCPLVSPLARKGASRIVQQSRDPLSFGLFGRGTGCVVNSQGLPVLPCLL